MIKTDGTFNSRAPLFFFGAAENMLNGGVAMTLQDGGESITFLFNWES
jgi:hypothetical protein